MSNRVLTYAVLQLKQVLVPNTIQNADPVRRYVDRGRRPQPPPLPAQYVSNCTVPTPTTRCLQGNQTHYTSPDVQHNYKIHFPALFFRNWAKWCGWWQPSKCWVLLQPSAHYTRLIAITMIVITSLHWAVKKRGEQHLEGSGEKWRDRRTVFRDVWVLRDAGMCVEGNPSDTHHGLGRG